MGLFPEPKKKVMIVDDELTIRDLIEFTLEPEFSVIKATSGEEALEKIKEEKPDILILDIMMPKLDGYEVCHRLKSDKATKEIPIIILTAKHQTPDIRRAVELKADEYITKPFEPDLLRKRIRTIFSGEKEKTAKLLQSGKSLHYIRGE